jgi:hypothetical protein
MFDPGKLGGLTKIVVSCLPQRILHVRAFTARAENYESHRNAVEVSVSSDSEKAKSRLNRI